MKLTGIIEDHGRAGFIAYTKELKGTVVQGDTIEEVKKELLISCEVKLKYDKINEKVDVNYNVKYMIS